MLATIAALVCALVLLLGTTGSVNCQREMQMARRGKCSLQHCCSLLIAPGDLRKDGCADRKFCCFAIGIDVLVSQLIWLLWQSVEIHPMQMRHVRIRRVCMEVTWK